MTLVLGIETSCDETAAAVVEDGRFIRSNVVASQVDLHRRYGGVFPEVAARQHILSIVPILQDALNIAKCSWTDLDAVAVTYGPGLVGSLLVGVNLGKAVAWAHRLPLVGVNHLEAHIYANWLAPLPEDGSKSTSMPPEPRFPFLCLIVSGGHSDLVLVSGHGDYRLLGQTLDDAAGEAFDKVARLLGLGYPGGPAIQQAAQSGNPRQFDLPRAWLKGSYDFSFSGLKTAVLLIIQGYEGLGQKPLKQRSRQIESGSGSQESSLPIADLAASFQAAVVEVLVAKVAQAAQEFRVRQVLLAGGVASNEHLRQEMSAQLKILVSFPPPSLCVDNAAMVASAGYFRFMAGERAGWDLDVAPNLRLAY